MISKFSKTIATSCFLLFYVLGHACTTCNSDIQEAIFNSTFYPNLLYMLSAFIILAFIVMLLVTIFTKRHRSRALTADSPSAVPLTTASMVLGIGLGGFVDGIVFHQILQWHGMLSNHIPPDSLTDAKVNMFWDGIFHAFTLICTTIGVIMLWKLSRRGKVNSSGYLLTGGLLIGWGLFNLVEGTIDHHMLQLHNVNEFAGNPDFWNYGFLAFSLIVLILGWIFCNKGNTKTEIHISRIYFEEN
jgi:uncharacterized membrane protein